MKKVIISLDEVSLLFKKKIPIFVGELGKGLDEHPLSTNSPIPPGKKGDHAYLWGTYLHYTIRIGKIFYDNN